MAKHLGIWHCHCYGKGLIPDLPNAVGVAKKKKKIGKGVPIVAPEEMNPTSNHKVSGLIPGLAQWVKDLALL